MKLDQLIKNAECKIIREPGEITKITHDSRQVTDGTLFICLRGEKSDGHNFIEQAAKAGAAAVLIEEGFDGKIPDGIVIISAKNTRKAMAFISANFFGNPAQKLRLVGVTGTNGKTTTTYYIEEILRRCGRKTGLIGTISITALGEKMDFEFATSTTPDPIELHGIFSRMTEKGVTDVVFEVSSHALALYKMEGLVFDAGVFTNLTQDHLDFHKTMDEYKSAKARLFAQSRFGIFNADDDASLFMQKALGKNPFYTYGIEKDADLRALHIAYPHFDLNGRRFLLEHRGHYNIYNALAAIGAAKALGLGFDEIRAVFDNKLSSVPGRLQPVPNKRGLNVFVDYAHSPDGLESTIKSVREFTKGRVITIFGCGGNRDNTKRPIMGEIAGKLSDYCILTSDNPRTENPFDILAQTEVGVKKTDVTYEIIENRRDAIFAGVKMLLPDDTLIIAGKGHEDYQEIGTVKYPFDDFETATEALK